MSDDPMSTQGMLLVSAHQLRLIEDDRERLATRVAELEAEVVRLRGFSRYVHADYRHGFLGPGAAEDARRLLGEK